MKILIGKTSRKYLDKLDVATKMRIISALASLPDRGDIEKLKGNKLHNLFRLRVGKFRIIYVLEEDIIRITDIDTRGDIYK